MKSYRWLWLGILGLLLVVGGAWLGYTTNGSRGGWGMMGGPGMMGGFNMMGGSGFPMMGLAGGLGMILFWVLVIAGIVWLMRNTSSWAPRADDKTSASETPFDILKRRYASGEITAEQFERMKQDLGFQ